MSKKNKKNKIRKDLQFIIDVMSGIVNIFGIPLKGIVVYFAYIFSDFSRILGGALFICFFNDLVSS